MPVPTPHIEAKKGEIARNVLMPGDPLRAKYVAEHFLEDARLVNQVRNVYAYTGTYKGKELTVMASGMGMPSIGIYSYELYKFYDVDNIIRIGSAGAYTDRLAVYDVVLADSAWSQSSFAKVQNGCMDDVLYPSESLNTRILDAAHCLQIPLKTARIHSSDVFYTEFNTQSGCFSYSSLTVLVLSGSIQIPNFYSMFLGCRNQTIHSIRQLPFVHHPIAQ